VFAAPCSRTGTLFSRFIVDSMLEEAGFEPSVPRKRD
jgi:hypothetical protein